MSRRRNRRGLALMMVLSLLVLFLLMGISFLMVANQSEKGARAQARTELRGDASRKHLEMAFGHVMRGANVKGFATTIDGHEILGDLYGNDGADGTVESIVATTATETGGQFIEITSTNIGRPWLTEAVGQTNPPRAPMPPQAHYLNGRVITMVTGVAKGLSSRVVESGPGPGNQYYIRLEAFESDNEALPQPLLPAARAGSVLGDRFIINGQPFNGSGAGYNPSTQLNDRLDGGLEIALMPNYAAYLRGGPSALNVGGPSVANVGGADESHDTVDYQNMFLAKVPAGATSGAQIIPSYHRPALVNYWQNRFATTGTALAQQKQIIRQFVLRPTQLDHHNPTTNVFFTGSNPAFDFHIDPTPTQQQMDRLYAALKSGNWDVDNDNDGIPDSLWLDLEFPLITSRNGRSVKPLVAILVKDLDNRLNLNAHSSLVQASGAYVDIASGQLIQASGAFAGPPPAVPTRNVTLPRGRGYGPADIYFGHLLEPANRANELNDLLNGRYADAGASLPGEPGTDDLLSRIKALRFPSDYPTQPRTPYGSPPDVHGYDAIGLNYGGHALSEKGGLSPAPNVDPTVDEAYELNLFRFTSSETGALDSPFTVAELERLLRFPDLDAAVLPSRILQAAQTSFGQYTTGDRERRNLVTTESRHVPVPNTRLDLNQRLLGLPRNAAAREAPNITDLLESRLISGGFTGDVDAQVQLQLPFEIRRGQLMNLNRLFGNGLDDLIAGNANGAVDDPAEADAGEPTGLIWKGLGLPAAFDNAVFDFANDQPFEKNMKMSVNRLQRQMYARHLYCLMMLLVDNAGAAGPKNWKLVHSSTEATLNDAQKRELVARRIAQWAINVVEFRDPDAIMTPFEYDVEPFDADGWDIDIDGDPSTNEKITTDADDRRIVWGMEYPDLLIKEATAFHDRRVKDTDIDSSGEKREKNGKEEDTDLDQYRLPQGSLFLELYCPRNRIETDAAAYAKFPRELYAVQPSPLRGNQVVPVLYLGQMAPNGPLGQHPVWRVAISEPNSAPGAVNTFTRAAQRPDSISFQPEDMNLLGWQNRTPADAATAGDVVKIERYVWFANVVPAANLPGLGVPPPPIYWNRYTDAETYLPAGGYAVVGPRLITHIGSRVEAPAIDIKSTKPKYLPSSQRIELPTGGAIYYDRTGAAHPAVAGSQKALSVIAAAARPTGWQRASADLGLGLANENQVGIGVSVSEPLPLPGNYYSPEPTVRLNTVVPPFPQDSWYDMAAGTTLPDEPFDSRPGMPLLNLTKTGTTPHYKTAFLQRLANPLEAYRPDLNPYITVDWTQIDLTVFSGEEDTDREITITGPPKVSKPIDPSDIDPFTTAPNEQFDSREKGTAKLALAAPAPLNDINPWTHTTTEPQTLPPAAGGDDYFKFNLRNTIGFLNSTFGPPRNAPPAYVGDPAEPWPWLTWNNRPFDTPLELMNVPATTLSRLPHEFTLQTNANPYTDGTRNDFLGPYQHMLNFLNTSANQNNSPHFYRLFDYVETPSPFVGAERWYPPQNFAAGAGAIGFRPPYNYLSRFRDPGRININTIFDQQVFEGLMKGFPAMDPSVSPAVWDAFQKSREGFAGGSPNNFPTQFAQPFRSAAQADTAPLPNMRTTGVQATILRANPNQPTQPLFDFSSANPYDHTGRNPALRYAGIERLANLVSTHSNVFAIWITVGYFEVEPDPSGVNRSGYRLGQEVGLDTGEVERHRAFYVVDRSIPVAYEPGENHNVENCILIRRIIE